MKILTLLLLSLTLAGADELRIFIRSGEKTHRPGCHDYPAFLKDWTALLNSRGAKTTGGNNFPTKQQLAETDVVILHAAEAGNIEGDDRKNFEEYLKRGGGVVAIHGGAVARDHDWYKTVIGGSWKFDQTKFLEDNISLYFTDRENPITKGISNFDLVDEIYYDMDILPDAKILAAAYTPKPKKGDASNNKGINIYDIQPQIWTYETDNRRAFTFVPGHLYENFSHTSVQTLLLRGIAWAAKAKDPDTLLLPNPELEKKLRYPVGGPTPPEEAAAKIELHPDFNLSLVAAEPLINKPLNIDWDAQGRMWVVESPEYPNGLRKANTDIWKDSGSLTPGSYNREPQDKISILTDTDGDGLMDKKQVFADKLELATGFVFHKNGVIVSAAPDIWFLEDTDGDEVADKRTKLYTGLGNGDTHAVMNNLRWGLDGWIYATHGYSAGEVTALGSPEKTKVRIGSGVVRFKPDGTEIEMFSSKRGNTWGLCMTSDGQCFWTQPTSGTVLFHTVLPENILAKGKLPGTESFHGMITGQKTFPLITREEAPYRQIDFVGSYTAASGCAIYEGGAWPEKWNYSYFTGEPTINIVSHYFVKPNGVTYTTEKEIGREETEFMRSSDLWFRPIETRVGPDGALYVIDFYNQAVIHNDTRGPQHGNANAAVRPDRDHYFGRIWKVQHKAAKKIEVPVIVKDSEASMDIAFGSANAHTVATAARMMREAGKMFEIESGSAAMKVYQEMPWKGPDIYIRAFAEANDDWTRSAILAAIATLAMENGVIRAALASPDATKLAPLVANLMPGVNEADEIGRIIVAAAKSPLKPAILEAAANFPLKPAMTPELSATLAACLAEPENAPKAMTLIARWDVDGKMKAELEKGIAAFSETLADAKLPIAARTAAARTLIAVGTDDTVAPAFSILQDASEPRELQLAIVEMIGATDFSVKMAMLFNELAPSIRAAAFDEIVKRPAAALEFLKGVEGGTVDPKDIGPGNVARLRSHPDKAVAARANALLDKLMPGAKEKAEIIAKFLPEVTKPGNSANGKTMYAAACAVCHKFGDVGKVEVGPTLTGMGSHGAAELLVHIIDPNREVDPTYWQWNITTKKGETLAGVITTENNAALTLRNQGGDTEIRKEDIASRVNTQRSLMPEGLDGLGPENLRDILAYMTEVDAGAHRVLDLRGAYTADARRGLFASAEATDDSVFPKKFGNISAEGIPFFLMDPARSPDGKSLIILKGGNGNNAAKGYLQKVEIAADVKATRLHLLSGIAGWGFPAIDDERPVMKVTLTHADGTTQVTELLNKRDFADYNREINVPGSKLVKGIVERGQLRLVTIAVKKPVAITKITLESYDNMISPVVAAITADFSAKPPETSEAAPIRWQDEPAESTAATGLRFAEPKKKDMLRVLLVGAGSSHHFPRDFIKADIETLAVVPLTDVIGTMNLAEALESMPKADVLVFSGNHKQWGTPEFQKALHTFADAGKGIVLLHAATWSHPWDGYNKRFVAGETKTHGKGDVMAAVIPDDSLQMQVFPNQPAQRKAPLAFQITKGVPVEFTIPDESYHFKFFDGAEAECTVLIKNAADEKSPDPHPALWIVNDPKARIICYTHGHDDKSHAHEAYKTILRNAVKWVSSSSLKTEN